MKNENSIKKVKDAFSKRYFNDEKIYTKIQSKQELFIFAHN